MAFVIGGRREYHPKKSSCTSAIGFRIECWRWNEFCDRSRPRTNPHKRTFATHQSARNAASMRRPDMADDVHGAYACSAIHSQRQRFPPLDYTSRITTAFSSCRPASYSAPAASSTSLCRTFHCDRNQARSLTHHGASELPEPPVAGAQEPSTTSTVQAATPDGPPGAPPCTAPTNRSSEPPRLGASSRPMRGIKPPLDPSPADRPSPEQAPAGYVTADVTAACGERLSALVTHLARSP